MNKPAKRILTGSFFISLLLLGSIFFFFPQKMTNDGLQKMLKEKDNVYYLSNVKEKELPKATFFSQKRVNNNFTFENNSLPPLGDYIPLHVNVSSNIISADMPNYSSRTLYSQNVLTPESEANEGNIGVGLMSVLSSGRHSNSNQSKRYSQSFSVNLVVEPFSNNTRVKSFEQIGETNLVEPFSNNTPTTLNRRLAGYAPNSGGPDPGDDPPGPPIPVGNGIGFLILLAVGYGIKRKFFIFKKPFLQRII